LRTGTKILDAKFVRYYLILFLGWGGYENPQENRVRFIYGTQLCHENKLRATTKNSFLVKKEWPN
jgi:hypothetical protein